MTFTTGRAWFGGMVITGLLLSSSLAGMHQPANSIAIFRPEVKPIIAFQSSQEIYQRVFEKQFKFVDSLKLESFNDIKASAEHKEKEKGLTVVAQTRKVTSDSEVNKVAQKKVSAKTVAVAAKRVQVAEASKKTQVARGTSDQASSIVNRALGLQGIPYVYGGTSRNGFDCSGFTQFVFKASGIALPRTSYDQYNAGDSVKQNELQPGDLVFFTTYTKGASHVGIYIGEGKFVHASNSGVRTTSLSNSYYNQRYLGARRVK